VITQGVRITSDVGVCRLANLANKGEIFRELYAHPQVLEAVEAVMGPEMQR
jgi:hypothetical protein